MNIGRRAVEWIGTGAVVLLAICAVALTAGNVRRAFFPSESMLTEPADSIPNWAEYSSAGNRVGPSAALVTLVVFSDYQCPGCRMLSSKLELIGRTYPREVAVVWRHLPLPGHPFALAEARASVCAGQAGRFFEMHSLLFHMQDSLGHLQWQDLAARAGVTDTLAFAACLDLAATQARIDSDVVAGRALNAVATPTLLVNERLYVGMPADLARIVRQVRRRRS